MQERCLHAQLKTVLVEDDLYSYREVKELDQNALPRRAHWCAATFRACTAKHVHAMTAL